jgi:hypothetical protein
MSIKHTYFKAENSSEAILLKDGMQTACPMVQPFRIPHPTIANQYSMGRMPCTSLCPLCQLDEEAGAWSVNCGSEQTTFSVEKYEEPKKSPFSIV